MIWGRAVAENSGIDGKVDGEKWKEAAGLRGVARIKSRERVNRDMRSDHHKILSRKTQKDASEMSFQRWLCMGLFCMNKPSRCVR